MKDFLTVKEFAEMAKKKPQTIYKQLDKRLKPYVKNDKGQKVISIEALKEFYGVEQPFQPQPTENQPKTTVNQPNSTTTQPKSTEENQPKSTEENRPKDKADKENEQIEALNRLIEIVQKQLEEKDKQLAVKDKQIADLSERLAEALQLTKGQQYIAAADKTKELLEADTSHKDEGNNENIYIDSKTDIRNNSINEEVQEQPKKKKGFLARLFGL